MGYDLQESVGGMPRQGSTGTVQAEAVPPHDCPPDSRWDNRSMIGSGVPPHVVPPDCVSRVCCPRSFMGKGRIERPFPIGDALAMRPLRKIPAGILLPLAELIFGERISLSAESDQGAALDLRFFEKNRVKLFCHYFRQKVLFVTNYLPGAFAKIVILQSRPSVAHVCARGRTTRSSQRGHRARARR